MSKNFIFDDSDSEDISQDLKPTAPSKIDIEQVDAVSQLEKEDLAKSKKPTKNSENAGLKSSDLSKNIVQKSGLKNQKTISNHEPTQRAGSGVDNSKQSIIENPDRHFIKISGGKKTAQFKGSSIQSKPSQSKAGASAQKSLKRTGPELSKVALPTSDYNIPSSDFYTTPDVRKGPVASKKSASNVKQLISPKDNITSDNLKGTDFKDTSMDFLDYNHSDKTTRSMFNIRIDDGRGHVAPIGPNQEKYLKNLVSSAFNELKGAQTNSSSSKTIQEISNHEKNFIEPKDEVEKDLEDIVFGAHHLLTDDQNGSSAQNAVLNKYKAALFDQDDADLIHEDTAGNDNVSELDDDESGPAWVDEDDEEELIAVVKSRKHKKLRVEEDGEDDVISGKDLSERLRKAHANVNTEVGWASNKIKHEENAELLPFQKVGGVIDNNITKERIDPDFFNYRQVTDLNLKHKFKSNISHMQFHPRGEAAFTTSTSRYIPLFQVDGNDNPIIHTYEANIKKVTAAAFAKGGDELVVAGIFPGFNVIDTETGKVNGCNITRQAPKIGVGFDLGCSVSPHSTYLALLTSQNSQIHLVSGKTKSQIGVLRVPVGITRAAVWDPNEKFLYTLSSTSDVFVWDPKMMRCINKFRDYGGFQASSMAMAPNGSHLAIGSRTGLVNLYSAGDLSSVSSPTPIAEIQNLTTDVNHLSFNHDSQLLSLSSSDKKDAARLFHIPTKRVVSNWPREKFQQKHVTSVAFSPTSNFFSVGNAEGRALLYRLNHYVSN